MKDLFPGYSKKSEANIKAIWDGGLLVFDTNVLLNLYRYSSATRITILDFIARFSDRIWLPHQAALEYNRNRYEVIADQEKAYKEFIDKLGQIQKDLQSASKPPFLSDNVHEDLNKVFEKVKVEVSDSIKKYSDYLREDPVYDRIAALFEGKIGAAYNSEQLGEICKQGEERYKAKIPPGYEDEKTKEGERKFGDWILWKQIIDKAKECKKPIILITDERKTDWWWKIRDGRNIGPRQELVEELKRESNMDFHMYSSERFLAYGQQYLQENVNQKALDELKEIKKADVEQVILEQVNDGANKFAENSSLENKLIRNRLNVLYQQIADIQNQQERLQDDAMESTEVAEYLHVLSMQKAELQEEFNHLQQQYGRRKSYIIEVENNAKIPKGKRSNFWGNRNSEDYWSRYRLSKDESE
jgi:rubrerythrin